MTTWRGFWLVYVAAAADCYVIGQQLHGDNFHERRERLDDMRDVDHTLHQRSNGRVAFCGDGNDAA